MTQWLAEGNRILKTGNQSFTSSPQIPWTPADISTYVWYDASDTSTITIGASGVSQLDDKSGNARHMVQADASEQPQSGVTTLNSLNVLDFDGAPINLETSLTHSGTDDTIIIGVFDCDVTSPVFNTAFFTFPDQFGLAANRLYGGNAGGVFSGTSISFTRLNDWQIFGGVLNWDASATLPLSYGQAWNNGTQEGSDNAYVNQLTNNARRLVLMAGNNPTGSTTGKFAEFIATNSINDTGTRQKLEGYLAWKWGLEGNLPLGHPYKDERPYK